MAKGKGQANNGPYLTELFEFPTQSESREDGILAGQRDERWGGQGLIDVEPGARVSQTVHLQKQRENLSHFKTIKGQNKNQKLPTSELDTHSTQSHRIWCGLGMVTYDPTPTKKTQTN